MKIKSLETIREHLTKIPHISGVYRMIGKNDEILYVGKAKDLYKRVASYTQLNRLTHRLQIMVTQIEKIEVTVTKNEAEALLLEASLIKNLQPRYNILLRDDKSFPYIMLRTDHEFGQITKFRGKQRKDGKYFGPFASVQNVNETTELLQKMFLLRSCSDNTFASRQRPCLLYQIKRCSAPCVNKISKEEYQESVKQAEDFLLGRTNAVQSKLKTYMKQASDNMEYELAATYRDKINALQDIQESRKNIIDINVENADVIAVHQEGGEASIQIFFIRAGQNFGNKAYFPTQTEDAAPGEILTAFIGQFYRTHDIPKQIIVNYEVEEAESLASILTELAKYKVEILHPKIGNKIRIIELAEINAETALQEKLKERTKTRFLLQEVAKLFDLPTTPKRIEVYDNSHIMGQYAVGAMIVAGEEGFLKNEYRKFNLADHNSDDYAMLREVLLRRFAKLSADNQPDLVLIDGGAGHLSTALAVAKEMNVELNFAAIAKGPERNAGKEQFFTSTKPAFTLPRDLPVMRYLQILRDEAHRFAITTHRKKRDRV